MFLITDDKEELIIKKQDLIQIDNVFILKSKNYFFDIEFDFVFKNKKLIEIRKCYTSANESGDVIKVYKVKKSKNERYVLKEEDFNEIKRIINKMNVNDFRKETIISSTSEIFACECYLNYYLEELYESSVETIFDEFICRYLPYSKEIHKYKKEIFAKTRELLKSKYEVDIDNIFKEVK